MQEKSITVKTSFIACHYWKDMPKELPHQYLKHPHRHVFNVSTSLDVEHDDRHYEFFDVKEKIDGCLKLLVKLNKEDRDFYTLPVLPLSCEMMADFIMKDLIKKFNLPINYVQVQEDTENYALVMNVDI